MMENVHSLDGSHGSQRAFPWTIAIIENFQSGGQMNNADQGQQEFRTRKAFLINLV